MLIQTVSVFGALMVLIAYAMIQSGTWRELDPGYLGLNILGSLLLGIVAILEKQIGFVLLEFAWAGLGAWGVARAWKARAVRRHHN
jgi:fluoride ion exporter CrcB/FEX